MEEAREDIHFFLRFQLFLESGISAKRVAWTHGRWETRRQNIMLSASHAWEYQLKFRTDIQRNTKTPLLSHWIKRWLFCVLLSIVFHLVRHVLVMDGSLEDKGWLCIDSTSVSASIEELRETSSNCVSHCFVRTKYQTTEDSKNKEGVSRNFKKD